MDKATRLVIYIFLSSCICLVMYLITAILFWYQGVNLHQEPAGVLAIIGYFVVPFLAFIVLEIEA